MWSNLSLSVTIGQIELFNFLKLGVTIIIGYLKPYSCAQIIFRDSL